ncbi:PAS domain-containing sensor histidine kinase [Coraliomargarita sp. SDUM461003]|uniref:histidine kinase n=1 Tax=Thalassobacterium maritimum TaxID=3041265 RepID=A0ABU1ARP8_9BACT|nr:PAS domain-containing sensor histidine kinase [Coraliomargarita sp. SDUM461003]MDQ8206766.1 PAS domain-containing sensor histidine kinase [Coraliomargarita sp. SDUM461003]
MNHTTEEALKATIYDLEQRLEIALLSANQVWWEWDIPTGILKTHAVKDCILGYDLGKIRHHLDFWMDALPPEEREPVWESLQAHLRGETEMWSMEHQYRNPQGEYKWVLEAGRLISRNQDGSPLRMVGITQNIHEKKLQEKELRKANEQLADALKFKDIVLATASHDVLNALTAGWTMTQLLKEKSEHLTEEFELVESSLAQSRKLISNIYDFSQSSLIEMELNEVDVTSIIRDTQEFHSPLAKNKQLDFVVSTVAHNPIRTDALALRRILDNLLGNAIKFTETGYIAISDISNEDELIIEVKDSGCGIPKEQAHLLFTPFKKLNSSNEGSGLGMSICQNLASKLSGQISYSPNAPQGTIFRLSLPREQPETK